MGRGLNGLAKRVGGVLMKIKYSTWHLGRVSCRFAFRLNQTHSHNSRIHSKCQHTMTSRISFAPVPHPPTPPTDRGRCIYRLLCIIAHHPHLCGERARSGVVLCVQPVPYFIAQQENGGTQGSSRQHVSPDCPPPISPATK